MSKLKTSFLKTLFVAISTLFIFGCTVNVSLPGEKPENGNGLENVETPSDKPDKHETKPKPGETKPESKPGETKPDTKPEIKPGETEQGGESEKPAEPKPQEPEYSSEYGIQITLSSQGGDNIPYDGKSLVIGQKYDVRGLDSYKNPSSLDDFTVHLNNKIYTGNNIDAFFEKEDKVFSGIHYYLLVLKDTLKSGDVIKFSGTVFGNKVITNELTIKAKSSSGGGSITPTPTPNPGTHPGGGSKPEFEIGVPQIIKHDYDKEVVRWFGGIKSPETSDFVDYKSDGRVENILDETGKVIGTIAASVDVPKYYVTDSSRMGADGNASTPTFGDSTWYNVTKSMVENTDSSMCWAMASAGAMHWWFDYLGEDYTKKLFEIRQNRTDLKGKNSSIELLFDKTHGNDIHYEPLPKEIDDINKILQRSGIGSYAVKSFKNEGGNPSDLFRLYFLDENTNRFSANYNKGPKSLGLLQGMGYPFSGINSSDDLLFEPVGLSNMRKEDIVRQFKTALDQNCAVVLHQANLPDDVLGDNGIGARAHHAIIVWGVIFDEKEENIVGLYVGDNNLKEGNLARVDLAFKQLSNAGGRYYYASPFVSQDSDKYMKQTSIYQITKLFPPKESTKIWIDDMYAKVVTQKQ